MNSQPKILVSIVNWNDSAGTNKCLASIAKIKKQLQPHVVVVDNGSQREQLIINPVIKQKLDSLKVIDNKSNLGFAGGHNPNIQYAKEQGFDYIVLLNNDTEVIDNELFQKLADSLSDNVQALGANPTILSKIKPDSLWYGGGIVL